MKRQNLSHLVFWKAARPFDLQNFSAFVVQKNFFVIPKRFKSEKQVFIEESEYHSGLISKEKDHKNLPLSPFSPAVF